MSSNTDQPEKVSLEDFYGQMTMPEEDAVEEYFGDTLEGLRMSIRTKGGIKWSRAVVFVFKMRNGLSPMEAHGVVGAMTRTQVMDAADTYLLDDQEEQQEAEQNWDEENPQTALGKDDEPDA